MATVQGAVAGTQTVSRAELTAVIQAFSLSIGPLALVTDSAYVYRGTQRGPAWRHRHHLDLWQELWTHADRIQISHFHKVKPHGTAAQLQQGLIDPLHDYVIFLADVVADLQAELLQLPHSIVQHVLDSDKAMLEINTIVAKKITCSFSPQELIIQFSRITVTVVGRSRINII